MVPWVYSVPEPAAAHPRSPSTPQGPVFSGRTPPRPVLFIARANWIRPIADAEDFPIPLWPLPSFYACRFDDSPYGLWPTRRARRAATPTQGGRENTWPFVGQKMVWNPSLQHKYPYRKFIYFWKVFAPYYRAQLIQENKIIHEYILIFYAFRFFSLQ